MLPLVSKGSQRRIRCAEGIILASFSLQNDKCANTRHRVMMRINIHLLGALTISVPFSFLVRHWCSRITVITVYLYLRETCNWIHDGQEGLAKRTAIPLVNTSVGTSRLIRKRNNKRKILWIKRIFFDQVGRLTHKRKGCDLHRTFIYSGIWIAHIRIKRVVPVPTDQQRSTMEDTSIALSRASARKIWSWSPWCIPAIP